MKQKVVIVDDHLLFSKALEEMVNHFEGYEVVSCAENGKDFIAKIGHLSEEKLIVLLDLNMPIMNGFETLQWIKLNQPDFKVLVLSMNDEEESIIKAVKAGANGYLTKSMKPSDLKMALDQMIHHGFYHNELLNAALLSNVQFKPSTELDELKAQEIRFLKLACTEMTYREIAEEMCLSPKTIDGYRHALFAKLGVKSRVGLVLYAMQHKILD
ncbi:MAG TPA: response regulator transcription factor [Moheibacter sp.]|nr:response regulator transcription factor [Moheibacter sp.]